MTDTPPDQPTNDIPPVPPVAPPIPPPAAPQYTQQQPYPQQGQPAGYVQQPPTEGLAIAALITGILFWPVGIVLGFIALSKIKKTGSGGRVLAILGIVFGFLGLVATIILIISTIVLGMLAAATVGQIADGYDDSSVGIGEVEDSVALGETGTTDDGMEFTVNTVECGIESVGPTDFAVEATGQFCRVDLTVTNNTAEPQYFTSSSVTGFADDTEYASDATAGYYDENASAYAADLNPGASSPEVVYIDMPDGVTLTRLELSESFLGGVVEVTL